MKRLLTFLIAMCFIATPILMAQSVGDYGSRQTYNEWNSTASKDSLWLVCATAGTWEGATTTTTPPSTSVNVFIRSGHTVKATSSSLNAKKLIIETGAVLTSSGTVASANYIKVVGDTILVNGKFGSKAVGLGVNLDNSTQATVITGNNVDSCVITRLRPSNDDRSVIIDRDIFFNYPASSTGSVLYNNSKNNFTATINAGSTITTNSGGYIAVGTSGENNPSTGGNFTLNVSGTINMGEGANINLKNLEGFTSTLNVTATGNVNCTAKLNVSGGGTTTINNDGTITVSGTADFSDGTRYVSGAGNFVLADGAIMNIGAAAGLDPTSGPIRTTTKTLSANATYVYNGTTAQVTGTSLPATIANLTISNTAGVSLSQATAVSGTLTLTSSNLALNSYTLTYATVSGDGTISETATLSAPSAVNVGSLGATITSTADLGSTVVKRGFGTYTINGYTSISRWYDITPTTNTGLSATLVVVYSESELNGLPEHALALYKSTDDGANWTKQGGTVDHYNNKITLTGVDSFSRWTIGVSSTMAGTYYVGTTGTKPGGGDPDYLTLKSACDALGNSIVTGDVKMLITSNLTEASYIAFGNPSDYQITFKPVAVDTITFSQTTNPSSTGWYGGWIIGSNDYTTSRVTPTRNITIDGSIAGGTKDLTIRSTSSVAGIYPIRVAGDVDNLTIKNCILRNEGSYSGTSGTYALRISGTYDATLGTTNPDNCLIDSCVIVNTGSSTSQGISIDGTSSQTAFPGVTVRNCTITARTRGIFMNYVGSNQIYNNNITVNQTTSGYMSYGIWGYIIGNAAYVQDIYNNKITLLSSFNKATGDYGIVGIQCGSKGTYNIYNNFITGFAATATDANPSCRIIGIRCATAGVTSNIMYNTIQMDDLAITPGTGTVLFTGINISAGDNLVYNNMIINNEDDFQAYPIYRSGTSGTLASNYNNFYTTSTTYPNIGYWNAAATPTLADWQTASALDANSISRAVTFAGTSDLHVSGSSDGDYYLAGTPLTTVTTDIDGDARAAVWPYMGADEGSTPIVVPDLTAPTVASTEAPNDSTVIVHFSEDIDATTGETETNYVIDHSMGNPLLATVAGADVTLKVTKLASDTLYTMTINNVADLSANPVATDTKVTFKWRADTESPTLVAAAASCDSVIVVEFSESVDATTGGTAANYEIDQSIGNPKSATVVGKYVTLVTTAKMTKNNPYNLTVNNVADLANNVIVASSIIAFQWEVETVPPTLVAATSSKDTIIVVEFSEDMDAVTGGTATNYDIDHSIGTPTSAVVSGKYVTLKVAKMVEDTVYTLTVNNVADLVGNVITANSTVTFQYVNPGMAGVLYVGKAGSAPGGVDPTFLTLKAACDSLNEVGIASDVTLYITSSLTSSANVSLGRKFSPYTLTIKPYTATVDTITFTNASDNVGVSGAFVLGTPDLTIGSSTNYGLATTDNIVIDGSNTVGGTTRDLMIRTLSTTNANTTPVRIFGDVNNVSVKNISVETAQSVSYGIAIVTRNATVNSVATNFVPDSIAINNCYVKNNTGAAAQGIAVSTSGTVTAYPSSIKICNNEIVARTRGIFLNNIGNTDVFGNSITVQQTDGGYMSYGIWGYSIGDASCIQNFYNNKITLLSTANSSSGDYGVIGIDCGSKGSYNVYNNMITGFAATTTGTNPNCKLIGIRLATAGVIANVSYNSIRMTDLDITPGTGTVVYTGIFMSEGTNTLVNNIVQNEEDDFVAYPIYRSGTAGTIVADYNDYYSVSTTYPQVGYWNSIVVPTLAVWQDSSSGDVNSISKEIVFTGATDLHLSGVSLGDIALAGTPLATITTDIDGATRSTTTPYIGADEGSTVLLAPITIGAAIADANGDLITDMSGQTATLVGIVTSPNMSNNPNAPSSANYLSCDYYMQDGTGGINIYSYSSKKFTGGLTPGDSIRVTGVITPYNGKTEIVVNAAADIAILGKTSVPEPTVISLAELNSEAYEGQLIKVQNLHPIKLSAWPVLDTTYSSNYSVYATDGGADTVLVFIDRQTDVITWEGLPYFTFDVVGIATQYSKATPPNTGYEVVPRYPSDFTSYVPTVFSTDLDESFETAVPPTGWYTVVTDLDSGTVTTPWKQGTISPVTGSYVAYMNNYNSASNCWLVTPALSIKGEKNQLSFVAFDEVNTTVGDYGSELVVLASTESGLFLNQWTEVDRITEAECVGTHPVWTVDLPGLSDTNWVYIAFVVNNFGSPSNANLGGDNWIVEDVKMQVNAGIKEEALPTVFALHQNYPNPFNPTTMIKYELPKESNVKLVIYDLMGREVRTLVNAKQAAGYKAIQWDSKNNSGRLVSSGYYICVMNAGDFHKNIKMVLIK